MNNEQTCVVCGFAKHWRRFRVRLGGGMFEESSTCSDCRAKAARADSAKKHYTKKSQAQQDVLNRTPCQIKPRMDYYLNRQGDETYGEYKKRLAMGVPYYYPKIEKQMTSYTRKKTAMDRKYLRDHAHLPLNDVPRIAKQQEQARLHAQGWIDMYADILQHAIHLLRQTGTRPPFALMEGSGTLQLTYGVYHTKRAQLLRLKG